MDQHEFVVNFTLVWLLQERKQQEEAMKKHELELDYLAPFLAQIGDPPKISRQEAYKLKEECLQDLKQRLIDKANLIQARFEKVTKRLTVRVGARARTLSGTATHPLPLGNIGLPKGWWGAWELIDKANLIQARVEKVTKRLTVRVGARHEEYQGQPCTHSPWGTLICPRGDGVWGNF